MSIIKYDIAKVIWDHLEHLYNRSDFINNYRLESEIMALKQNKLTMQEFIWP